MTSSVVDASVGNMSGISESNSSLDNLSLPKYVSSPKSLKKDTDPNTITAEQAPPPSSQQQQSDILYISKKEELLPVTTLDTPESDSKEEEEEDLHSYHLPHHWPPLWDDAAAKRRLEYPPTLPSQHSDILHQVQKTHSIQIRIITWNQQHVQERFSQHSPIETQVIQLLQKELIPLNVYHFIVMGTQECQTSIAKSFFFKSKEWWEHMCSRVVGEEYELVRGHSLQATHLVVFAHKAIHSLISQVQSHAVATGILDTMGNKGGIGISMKMYGSTFCFLTAHLAAHIQGMDRRTEEFLKISMEMSQVLGFAHRDDVVVGEEEEKKKGGWNSSSRIYPIENTRMMTSTTIQYPEKNCLKCLPRRRHYYTSKGNDGIQAPLKPDHNPLMDEFDFVFWAGDFNYRIFGSRDVVDTLLDNNRHDVLWNQDQLFTLMQYDSIFTGFKEGPVHFKPSYKLNVDSDVYDTSRKRRVPAWTDRILHKGDSPIKQISYSSATKVRLSDHRPVYASYQCMLSGEIHEDSVSNLTQEEEMGLLWSSETKSEVCVIL